MLCRVVMPTSSISGVRMHFWMLVAVAYGGVRCPRKNGTNWTMPALTNNRLGSSRITEALGTSVWPAFTK